VIRKLSKPELARCIALLERERLERVPAQKRAAKRQAHRVETAL
jgi:hypothetical protein